MGGGLSSETSELLMQQTALEYNDALKQLYEENNSALYRSADISSNSQDLIQFFADIGCSHEAAVANMEKCFALNIRTKNSLFSDILSNSRLLDFLALSPEQRAFINISSNTFALTSQLERAQAIASSASVSTAHNEYDSEALSHTDHPISSLTPRFNSERLHSMGSPMRNHILENANKTASEMLEILKKAYSDALQIDQHLSASMLSNNDQLNSGFRTGGVDSNSTLYSPRPPDDHLEPAFLQDEEDYLDRIQEECQHSNVDVIHRWNTSLSSPLLEFSDNIKKVWRSGVAGYFPAALVHIARSKTLFNVKLEKAPNRNNYFSFGISSMCTISSEVNTGCFGHLKGTWGLSNRRSLAQPIEIWGDGRKITSKQVSLKQGDLLTLYLDMNQQKCLLFLNKQLLHEYRSMPNGVQLVMGAILCDDHKLSIIPQELESNRGSWGHLRDGGDARVSDVGRDGNSDYDSRSPLYSYQTINPASGSTSTNHATSTSSRVQARPLPLSSLLQRGSANEAEDALLDSMLDFYEAQNMNLLEQEDHRHHDRYLLPNDRDYQYRSQQNESDRYNDNYDNNNHNSAVHQSQLGDNYDDNSLMFQQYMLNEMSAEEHSDLDRYGLIDEYDLLGPTPEEVYESMRASNILPVPNSFPRNISLLGDTTHQRISPMVSRITEPIEATSEQQILIANAFNVSNTSASLVVTPSATHVSVHAESKDHGGCSSGDKGNTAKANEAKSFKAVDAETTILCCICLEHTRCILLIPCKHLCLCESCSQSELVTSCPICRQNIEHSVKVFL